MGSREEGHYLLLGLRKALYNILDNVYIFSGFVYLDFTIQYY